MTFIQTAFQRAVSAGATAAKTEAEHRKISSSAAEKLRSLVAYCDRSLAPVAAQYIEELQREERLKVARKLEAIATSGELKGRAIGTECKGLLKDLIKELS